MEPVTMIIAACLITGGVASPAIVDTVAGEAIGADNPIHGFEKIGEGMKGALGLMDNGELIRERIRELEQLSGDDQAKVQEQIREINRLMEQHRNEINEDAYQNMVTTRNTAMNRVNSN